MCESLFWTDTALAAISDPTDHRCNLLGPPPPLPPPPSWLPPRVVLPLPPLPPLPPWQPKEMTGFFRFAATLQHLVDTALAGKGYSSPRPPSIRRFYLN